MKIPKIFLLAPSALANYEFDLVGMCAENVHFSKGNLAPICLSCVFFAHYEYICGYFSGFKCEKLQIFLLAPSALAKSEFEFQSGYALKICNFEWAIMLHFGFRVCFAHFEYLLWYLRLQM